MYKYREENGAFLLPGQLNVNSSILICDAIFVCTLIFPLAEMIFLETLELFIGEVFYAP